MKKILKFLLSIISIVLIALVGFIVFTLFNDYKPEDVETLHLDIGSSDTILEKNTPYTIVTFNTGYGGLGESQDFFMDGGTGSGAKTKEEALNNTQAITNYLDTLDADFNLLQEVDLDSKRSQRINQYEQYLNHQNKTFAMNYRNSFVPVPLTRPMGHVKSGIVTASKSIPFEITRHKFEGEESFLVQLFELDRNFTISQYYVEDKILYIINAHFSAYDKGGKIRQQQLNQIQNILIEAHNSGHYVILGGDFNHELPGADSSIFTYKQDYPDWIQSLPSDFTPQGYTWAIDPNTPTVRDLMKPYVPGDNFVAVIDGFLVSDNIEIIEVKTEDLGFVNSDHNPVVLEFSLKD